MLRLPRHSGRRWAVLSLALLLPCAALAQESYVLNAYIPNYGGSSVSVIDTATNTVTGTIGVGYEPMGVAVSADGSTAYVANLGDNTVSVIDAASGTVATTIHVGSMPTAVAVTPNGAKVYVANGNDNTVSVIDTTTETVVNLITVGNSPDAVTITPDGTKAYVADSILGLSVIDTRSDTVIATLNFDSAPIQIAITPDSRTAYITNVNYTTVLDIASNTVTTTLNTGNENAGVAISPGGTQVWIVNGDSSAVLVIDIATESLVATIPVGNSPNGLAFSADGTKAFVVNFGDDDVSVIDTLARKVVATLGVGNSPNAVGMFIAPAPPASALVAAILPGGRSVQLGNPATVFATVLNAGAAALDNCQIALPGPDGLSLDYQTTDPATNALIGRPNSPVTIPGNGYQTFILTFQANAALTLQALPLVFGCDGTPPAPVTIGVDTIDLIFSPVPIADMIALAATASGNGVVSVPYSQGAAGAFALASVNAGAAGDLTVVTDTGDASLPITVTLCQTDPSNGQCLAPPTESVAVSIAANATPTFSIFVSAAGTVGLHPGRRASSCASSMVAARRMARPVSRS